MKIWFGIILLTAILLPGVSQAELDSWSAEDATMEVCWQALNIVDMIQAYDDHGWGDKYEIGHGRIKDKQHLAFMFGGPDVRKEKIPIVAAGAAVAHFGVSAVLPKKPRKWWQRITVGIWFTGVMINTRW